MNKSIFLLSLGFFTAQILQELTNESLNTSEELRDAPLSAPLFYTFSQFFGTVFLSSILLISGRMNNNDKTKISQAVEIEEQDNDDDDEKLNEKKRTFFQEWLPIFGLACLIFVATGFPNIASTLVDYPVKVVFKSSKLIPTMVVSVLLGNHAKFNYLDYLCAVLLCLGAAGFAFSSNSKVNTRLKSDNIEENQSNLHIAMVAGVTLLSISIFADALVSNFQQKIMSTGFMTADELMVKTNALGSLVMITLLILSGDAAETLEYSKNHPWLLIYIILGGLFTGLAVVFYIRIIRDAGSVVAVAIATLRKIVTILLSFLVFPKKFSIIHVFASLAVGIGLFLQIYRKYHSVSSSAVNSKAKKSPEITSLINTKV